MMKEESRCVHCHKELGCIREACPNFRVKCYYCDACLEKHGGENPASYEWDGDHFCEDCLNDHLNEYFNDNYSLNDMIKTMGWDGYRGTNDDQALADIRNEFNELPISEKIEQLELDKEIKEV